VVAPSPVCGKTDHRAVTGNITYTTAPKWPHPPVPMPEELTLNFTHVQIPENTSFLAYKKMRLILFMLKDR
jgi:hypothetical protein